MSGTIVDRRDQVFTTFFSLRVFSPSTFSRRCPSTNGPFFSEPVIFLLSLDPAQTSPRSMPHFFESTYRSRNAMRFWTKRTNKTCPHGIRSAVYNHRPSRLAKLVQHRLQRNRRLLLKQYALFCNRLRHRLAGPLNHPSSRRWPCYTLARPLRAATYCCPASCRTTCSCAPHRLCSSFADC